MGQRDYRRRRLLLDRSLGASAPSAPKAAARPTTAKDKKDETPQAAYTEAALAERQPRVTDLLPLSIGRLMWLFGLCVLAVGSVVALHVTANLWTSSTAAESIAPLDLGRDASIGAWLSSLLLLVAAIVSLQIYSVRQHRRDDYQGRYRVWRWTACALLAASINATASIHRLAGSVCEQLIGWLMGGDSSFWGAVAFAFLAGALTWSLLVEVVRCTGSFLFLGLTAACYAAASAIHLDMAPFLSTVAEPGISAGRVTVAAESACWMLGHVMALMTTAFFARHVHWEVQADPTLAIGKPRVKKRWLPNWSWTKKKTNPAQDADADNHEADDHSKNNAPVEKSDAETSEPVLDQPQAKRRWLPKWLWGSKAKVGNGAGAEADELGATEKPSRSRRKRTDLETKPEEKEQTASSSRSKPKTPNEGSADMEARARPAPPDEKSPPQPKAEEPTETPSEDSADWQEENLGRKLSKAERRKMRREKRRQSQ